MIRPATIEDVPRIVAMAERIARDSDFQGVTPDAAHIEAVAHALLSGDAVILLAEHETRLVGMLALVAYRHLLTGHVLTAQACWWVDPEARGIGAGPALLRCGEAWSRGRGARAIQMTAPTAKYARAFQRRGYRDMGAMFERRLECRG